MLNRIAASAGTFIPVSTLLLDMLEMKELNRRPTGGVGKAVDLRTVLKVYFTHCFLYSKLLRNPIFSTCLIWPYL